MKKFLSLFLGISLSLSLVSCGEKGKVNDSEALSHEQFNKYTEVRMDNGVIARNKVGYPVFIDYETMESTLLCNIPNCSHNTSDCLISELTSKTSPQLPIIYNNCAYYFRNMSEMVDNDGKRDIKLDTKLMKYDFANMTVSEVADIKNFNANCSGGGSYLVGSNYYFTTNNGDPDYDEAGNLVGSSNGGQAKLYCINLDTKEITDHGEIFDYETYKKRYSGHSILPYFIGKNNDQLFLKVVIGEGSKVTNEVYEFDLNSGEINRLEDKMAVSVGDNCIAYYTYNGKSNENDVSDNNAVRTFAAENLESGEVVEGSEVLFYNVMNICDNKVWCDSKCMDITTGKCVKFSDLDAAIAIGTYENNYIICGESKDGTVYDKIPTETIDELLS